MNCSVPSSAVDLVSRLSEIVSSLPATESADQLRPSRSRPKRRRRTRRSPLPNGDNGEFSAQSPSPNGDNGEIGAQSPSPNGDNGDSSAQSPSPNGDNGENQSSKRSARRKKGRDSSGRFAKGNEGGPGNPFARRIAAFRSALCAVVTEKDIQQLAYQLLAQAQLGDWVAAKLLLAYAIGRPTDAVDPDTLDLKEWQLFRDSCADAQEVAKVFNSPPPAIVNAFARVFQPAIGRVFAGRLADEFKEDSQTGQHEEKTQPRD